MITHDLAVKSSRQQDPLVDSSNRERSVEFDVHGIVGVRLVDPSPEDLAGVSKQLGLPPGSLLREPDITIRFVERLPIPGPFDLGLAKEGFTRDGFFTFETGARSRAVRIPLAQLGEACEIVCERGLPSVPLLMPILALTALAKGYVAVHASAFVYNGVGTLVVGSGESGKTTALLGFASQGAEFIGEDWVLVGGDEPSMCGLPTEIELSLRHLDALPDFRRSFPRPRLWALEALGGLDRLQEMSWMGAVYLRFGGRILRRLTKAIEQRIAPKVTPRAIFGHGLGAMAAKPERLFLLIRHSAPRIEVDCVPSTEMAQRLTHLVQHEQASIMSHYRAFRVAFADARNNFLERANDDQLQILSRALSRMETYTVRHPYPLVFSKLYEKIRPFCEAPRRAPSDLVPAIPKHSSIDERVLCKQ
jgi:hypothetical protein